MCYDISYNIKMDSILDYFPEVQVDPQIDIDFGSTLHVQAQSYKKCPVVLYNNGKYMLKPLEWGVIADYMDTPEKIKKSRSFMCNARSEKIMEDKKSYWYRIRSKRCLMPVAGIFEHREIKGWKKKVPYFVQLKNREMFCIPGLYHYPHSRADVETGEITGTFTIITRSANSIMKQIHNGGDNAFRMPLFLPKELEIKWLQPELSDEDLKQIMDYEMPSEELKYHAVDTIRTTKERADGKTKIDEFGWANLPPLGQDNIETSLF